MTSPSAFGALLGLVAITGILLMVTRWRRLRRPRLIDRVRQSRSRATDGVHRLESLQLLVDLLSPLLATITRSGRVAQPLGKRLQAAGRPADVNRHRLSQLAWMLGGFIAGATVGSVIALSRSGSLVVVVVLGGFGTIGAYLLQDTLLTFRAARRGRRMDEQLPTVAELLAFAVAAGEPPLAALERVSRTVDGELASELTVVVDDVHVGASLSGALRDLGERSRSQAIARFVDGIVVSLERGSPLADVLRAQAADARAAGRRHLMESAGRREVAMLVPVVFLILPIVVVIALFPGVYGITLSIP